MGHERARAKGCRRGKGSWRGKGGRCGGEPWCGAESRKSCVIRCAGVDGWQARRVVDEGGLGASEEAWHGRGLARECLIA